jgi:hypothetical protein
LSGLLYAEYVLKRLNAIGGEVAVLKELEKLPNNLPELFEQLVYDCYRNRTDEIQTCLQTLFAWLAHANDDLTLNACNTIVRLTHYPPKLDVEEEVIHGPALLVLFFFIAIEEANRVSILKLTEPFDYEGRPDVEDFVEGALDEQRLIQTSLEDEKIGHGSPMELEIDAGIGNYSDMDDFDQGDSRVSFCERSLKDYFRASPLNEPDFRTSPLECHLIILEISARILSTSDEDLQKPDHDLLEYAVAYWMNHFQGIDIASAKDEDIKRVLGAVFVITRAEDVSSYIELYGMFDLDIIYPINMEASGQNWIETLKLWVERASSLPTGTLDPLVELWIKEMKSPDFDLLANMATRHIKNWYDKQEMISSYSAFNCARAALGHVRSSSPC